MLEMCDSLMFEFFRNMTFGTANDSYNSFLSPFSELQNTEGQRSETRQNRNHGHAWYEIVIPMICVFGVVGNILNLIVLTRRKHTSRMDALEKSATYGLIALAFSDMFFCIMVFPHSFIQEHKTIVTASQAFHLYYKLYGVGLINLFLMVSTWLIVYMAINRYLVVVYPFQARWTLGTRITLGAICSVYLLATVFTLPFFLHMTIDQCQTMEGDVMYEMNSLMNSHVEFSLTFYIRWIWPVIADFIPLVLLAFINIRLIKELKLASMRRQDSCQGQTIHDSSHRITLTLVIIVLLLLFLVSPSEILRYVNPYENMGKVGHVMSSVTNVFQTCNFAINFILYCFVSRNFRQTVKSLFHCDPEDGITTHTYVTGEYSTNRGTARQDRIKLYSNDKSILIRSHTGKQTSVSIDNGHQTTANTFL